MQMRHYFFIGFVSLCSLLEAQSVKNICIPRVASAYAYNQCEPSIAINPLNPQEISAGTVLQGYHFSTDGGQTWTSQSLKSPYGVYGDPVLQYDNNGRLYYFHLSDYKQGSHLDRIVCQIADKPGQFSEGSFPNPNGTKVQDKHWVVIDPITNFVYMTWTQFDAYNSANPKDSSIIVFSKSMDRGLSWTEPIRISKFGGDCLDGDNTVEGAVPALGPNGEIFVCWSGPRGIMLQKSTDGGLTWYEEERKIADHFGGWDINIPGVYRANGLPFLMSDLSGGKNHGHLYLNWCDQRNGVNNTDVWLLKSVDGGESWSEPIRVNQDHTQSHQFLSSMTIDPKNGDLHFVYYDRRRFNDNRTDVYWAHSSDGGVTINDLLISKKPFVPNSKIFFGDYLGIAALDGRIRPIWPRMDNGKISLWVALIDLY
jgi:hypothetical protein